MRRRPEKCRVPSSFDQLVQHVALRFHGESPSEGAAGKGCLYPIGRALRAPTALIPWWADGTIKNPTDRYLRPFCELYHLNYWGVRDLVSGRPGADPFANDPGWVEWYRLGCPPYQKPASVVTTTKSRGR